MSSDEGSVGQSQRTASAAEVLGRALPQEQESLGDILSKIGGEDKSKR